MFKILLENNYSDTLKKNAYEHIKNERMQYKDIIYFILKYISDNKLLISNVDILLDKHKYWDSVNIFTLNVDETAKSLVSKLCKKFNKLFFMKIVNENNEYFIEYNLRKVCILNSIQLYKSYSLYDFISPVKLKIENLTIFVFPYLLEIIHLYGKLYDPSLASDWKDIYADVLKMEIYVDKEINKLLTSTKPKENINNSPDEEIIENCNANKCKQNQTANVIEIKKMVLEFFKDGQYILCDEFYDIDNPVNVIEVISDNVEADYNLLVNYLAKFISYGVTYKKKSIHLPKDFQMEKYNFYVEIPFVKNLKRKHFLTIYNNTSFELINYYEKNHYKYADPITQLKFAYIYIWSINISRKVHSIDHDEFISILKKKKEIIDKLRKKVNIYEIKKNYHGTYISEFINKKMTLTFTNKKSNYYCHDFQSSSEDSSLSSSSSSSS